MKSVLKISLLTMALVAGGAAMAQDAASSPSSNRDYPTCSKTVIDECMEAAPSLHRMKHHAKTVKHSGKLARHDKTGHPALAKPATPTQS